MADPKSSRSTAKNVAGLLICLTLFASAWLPLLLAHYVTDRVLAGSEVVELELALHKKYPDRYRSPWEYVFEVDGQRYSGTPYLSEEGIRINHETEEATATVVYARDRPKFHRVEPAEALPGVALVGIFPKWLVLCLMLGLTAAAVASWEELARMARARCMVRRCGRVVLLNFATVPVLILLPAAAFGWFFAVFTGYGEYAIYEGLAPAFALATAVLAALLVAFGILGKALDAGAE